MSDFASIFLLRMRQQSVQPTRLLTGLLLLGLLATGAITPAETVYSNKTPYENPVKDSVPNTSSLETTAPEIIAAKPENPNMASKSPSEEQAEAPTPVDKAKSAPIPATREMSTEDSAFFAAVQNYRKGDYTSAKQAFSELHRQDPNAVRVIYYLAMTEAQLGNFKQAERGYKEAIRREPDGKIGLLAREGLKALPTETTIDHPPRFPAASTSEPAHGITPTPSTGAGLPVTTGTAAMPAGMSPQDWMMLQTMMSGAGNANEGGGNGNNNWGMLAPMMMMQPSANGGPPSVDPEVMKTILMNQMMQGFDLNPSGKDRE